MLTLYTFNIATWGKSEGSTSYLVFICIVDVILHVIVWLEGGEAKTVIATLEVGH